MSPSTCKFSRPGEGWVEGCWCTCPIAGANHILGTFEVNSTGAVTYDAQDCSWLPLTDPTSTPHPPPTPRGPCHRATVGLGEGRESARMGNPSELLASAGVIGIRPEGPGQGSKQGGRHGKPSITLHCPPHGTPRSWADALSCTDGHYSPPLDLQ